MVEEDKMKFKNMLDTVMALYGKPSPDRDTMRVWWLKLQHLDFSIISNAFNMYVDKYKIMPNVASILELCRAGSIKEFTYLPRPKLSEEEYKKSSERVKKLLQEFAQKPKPEPKDWARKIIANPGKYPDISVRYAKEALYIKEEVWATEFSICG